MMNVEEKPKPLFQRTIAGDLTISLVLVILAVFLAFGVASYMIIAQRTTVAQAQQTAVLADNLAIALEQPLATGNAQVAARLAQAYEQAESVARVLITGASGAPIYNTPAPTSSPGDYTTSRVIAQDGRLLGQVSITFTGQVAAQTRQSVFSILITLLLFTLLVIILVTQLLIRRFVSRPLNSLASGMGAIADGDYSYRLPPLPQVDAQAIATLSATMAEQIEQRDQELRELIQALEVRVAERTRDLTLAADIGQSVSQLYALEDLLPQAVDLIREQFDLYHVQIYLADDTGENLLLRASTGPAGQQMLEQGHRLPISLDSINGRAALEKRTIIVANTASDPFYLAHPLLPDTLAETAVPLIVGQRVLGVMDLQSSRDGDFSPERAPALEIMGELLAIAIESARRLQTEANLRAELDENGRFLDSILENLPIMLFVKDAEELRFIRWNKAGAELIGQPSEVMIGKTDYDFFPPEEAEFFIQKDRETLEGGVLLDIPEEPIETAGKGSRLLHTIKVPILDAQGRPRYLMGISQDITERKEAERMLAERIKELKVLNNIGRQTEQRPSIPEFAQYIAEQVPSAMQYPEICQTAVTLDGLIYGQPEAIDLPCQIVEGIRVGGEQIGRIVIAYTEKQIFLDEESALIGEIGRRLSSYIESQRLFQQVQANVADLQTVTEIGLAVAASPDKQQIVREVVDLTQVRFGLYHAQIYLYDDKNNELRLEAAAGEIGRRMMADSHPISLQYASTPVARAANSRQPLLINDTQADPTFAPHPLLPQTRAQLLLPLIVGDALLGVWDVQADQPRRFAEAEVNIQTSLAAQVALALQNADRYEQSQAALLELNTLQRLMAHEGWGNFQRQRREAVKGFVASHDKLEPITGDNGSSLSESPNSLVYPLEVRGVSIGSLGVRDPDGRSLQAEDRLFLESASLQIAQALEKSRLFAETELARSQTEALLFGSEKVVHAQSMDDILKALVETTELRRMERASLLFFDTPWEQEQPQSVTLTAAWLRDGSGPLMVEIGTTLPLQQYPLANLMHAHEPLIIEDAATDERLPETTRMLLRDFLGMTSAIAVPLVAGELWIGFALCMSTESVRWAEDEIRQIVALANQAATVAQTLRLFADAQLRAEQEQILRQVSGQVYAAADAEAVLRIAAEEIGRALGLETFVYLEEGGGTETAVFHPTQANGNG
jgi:PAS domain S-box-containing protein